MVSVVYLIYPIACHASFVKTLGTGKRIPATSLDALPLERQPLCMMYEQKRERAPISLQPSPEGNLSSRLPDRLVEKVGSEVSPRTLSIVEDFAYPVE